MEQIVGVCGIVLLLAMILLRVPIAAAMGLVGFIGYGMVNGWSNAARVMGQVPFDSGSSYTLSQLPLFVLMGDLAVRSGMSGRLYSSAQTMFSGLRGSQAFATLGASAGFGAVSGSSIATAATMTRVALPSMRSARYDDRLSVGSVAAGGTLGILIPPSIALVVYGMIAEQSVPRLYAASLLPGILLFAIYVVIVALLTAFKSGMAPKEALRASLGQRVRALANVWEITLLFVVVIGGIYTGMLSATEAAAVGAAGAFLLGFLQRKLTLRDTMAGLRDTILTSSMLFMILISANIFTYFVVLTKLPQMLISGIDAMGIGSYGIMLALLVFYIILDCFLEAFGMILITVPIFLPLVQSAGFDPIWFGVFLVLVVEAGMITPPVGMNIFVIQAQASDIPLIRIYQAVMPYVAGPILLCLLLVIFPAIALFLPEVLFAP